MASRAEILGKLGKLGSQAFVSAATLRREVESVAADRLEKLAKNIGLVRKEEFEQLRALLVAARREQDELRGRLESVEKKLNLKSSAIKKAPLAQKAKKAKPRK